MSFADWIAAQRHPVARANREIWKKTGGQVAHGPFTGMRLTRRTTGALLPPYLLGSFEAPLHPVIQEWHTAPPDVVVNIGAGDGYYAAGFASRWPQCRVVAGDPLPAARANTLKWITAAGVQDRVEVVDGFSPGQLTELLHPARELTCIWCDCEGEERRLADPATIPAWTGVRFVIEVHPWTHRHLEQQLVDRFRASHHLRWIEDAPKRPREWPLTLEWPQSERMALLDEGREHPGKWLVGAPRT